MSALRQRGRAAGTPERVPGGAQDAQADDLRVGVNLFLAADTLIGPVFITAGAADDGRTALYFFIGKPF